MQETLIMVDTEYSGPSPGDYSLLSIGATVVGQHAPPYNQVFHTTLKPLPYSKAEPEAMHVNGMDLNELERNGESPAEALGAFARWVNSVAPPQFGYPVMVADGQHDFMWLRWYFDHFNVRNPFVIPGYNPAGHGIDMKSYLMGMHPRLSIRDTRRSRLLKLFPEYVSHFMRTHHALDDAIEQAERFQRMLARQQ